MSRSRLASPPSGQLDDTPALVFQSQQRAAIRLLIRAIHEAADTEAITDTLGRDLLDMLPPGWVA